MNLDDVVTDSKDRVLTGVGMYREKYAGAFEYYYAGITILVNELNN